MQSGLGQFTEKRELSKGADLVVYVTFKVFVSVSIIVKVVWGVTPCSLVDK
jgi:hypothetical protein